MTPADKKEPVALCMACEGKPALENNPCAVCGATRPTSDLAERIKGLVGKVDAHLNAAEALLQNPNDTALKVVSRVLLELSYAKSILAALKEVNSHDRT